MTPLAETKLTAKTFGVTLNDGVMGTTAGALRRQVREYDDLPDKPVVAAVPVSLRAQGDESANIQVSMLRMSLGTDVADPVERLKVIHESSDAAKAMMSRVKTVIPSDFLMLGSPWLVSGTASLLLGRLRLAKRGAALCQPDHLQRGWHPCAVALRRRQRGLLGRHPVSIPAHSMALNVTVQPQRPSGFTA
ncbi:WS/DGAT domain-containing protein [Candidatus Skiveiella danica]|uniref:WS/DGAT domain-containing protein n=1 Tax=Candidatus Skiveiella danica TaxID=3386177 RepID=UPI0039B871CD